MNFWNKLVVGIMTLALGFSLSLSSVSAASTSSSKSKEAAKKKAAAKKKEAEKKKEAKKKEERHEAKHYSKSVIDGLNIAGRPGYFFGDTATNLNRGQVAFAAHLTFDTWASVFQIPFGGSFGITDQIQVNASSSFYSISPFPGVSASGLNFLDLGGKYAFRTSVKNLKIAAGIDFLIGPLSNSLGGNTFGFDPYGVVTYTFVDGLQLNGRLGLYIQTYDFGGFSGSYSFFQCDLGAAYPFDANLTGIAELATNGVVQGGGLGGTPLLVGIRTGHDVQLQAFAGLDLGGEVGFFVGGGVALISM